MSSVPVVVIAKEPVPGKVKTRLCPPLTPEQAAFVAQAALLDTLDSALASSASQVVLALDGRAGGWLPDGVVVIAQRGGDLADRLANVFDDLGGPGFVIGMDTPQVSPRDIDDGLALLERGACDAVLGPAADGGYWAIGLAAPDRRAFDGVPMSRSDTGLLQLAALDRLGLTVGHLRELVDVDLYDDARTVAVSAPGTRFADACLSIERRDPTTS